MIRGILRQGAVGCMWEAGPLRCSLEVGLPTMPVLLLLARAVLGLPEGVWL